MKSNTKNQWMLPLGSAFVAAVIAAGAWFGVDALRTGTPEVGDIALITDTPEVEDIALITDTPEVEDIALITDTPEVEDIALTTDTQESEMTYVVTLSMDVYPTLDGLSGAADIVVLGTVSRLVESGNTRGMEQDGGTYPYNLYEFEIVESFKGDVGGTIYVVRTDPSLFGGAPGMAEYPLTTLSAGDTVVLYLDSMSAKIVPETGLTGTLYGPVSFDNGVFDVTVTGPIGAVGTVNDDTKVHPRGVSPSMFAKGTVFTAADIRQAIEPDSGEEGPVGSTN